MTQIEFMKRLEELLQGISLEEREAALLYYEDYFEDAGPDQIGQVIAELGSPEKVAATITGNLNNVSEDNADHIIYTEHGYKDTSIQEEQYEVIQGNVENHEDKSDNDKKGKDYQYRSDEPKSKSDNKKVNIPFIILLAIFAIPVGIPLIASAFGIIVGILGAALGIFIAIVVTSVAFLFAGLILFIAGVIQLFIAASDGILMCGVGLVLFGLGTLGSMITIFFSAKVVPTVINGIVTICRKPFQKRGASV